MDSELKQLLAERDELNEKIKKAAKAEFGALVAGIFETYEIKNFGWWNAGDEAYNDGTYPGLSSLAVNIDMSERYAALHNSDPAPADLVNLLKPFEDLALELWPGGETLVVFPDRVETFWMDY